MIFIVARLVKIFSLIALLCGIATANGGTQTRNATDLSSEILDAPHFEFAVESAYLMCFINNPHSYEIGAEFLTARMRWGVISSDSWLRGYNQMYFTAEAQPIFRGVENHYFGINLGYRYNFVRPNSRWVPYFSGGLGLGWIDSNAAVGNSQGQDFTFNILSAVGVSYRCSQQWKIDIGVLYEHFSNANQTDPNPSLNLIGPQLAATYSF